MVHLIQAYSPLKSGFSFYKLSDPYSFGFKFKFKTLNFAHIFMVRYSKTGKYWSFMKTKADLYIDPETGCRLARI